MPRRRVHLLTPDLTPVCGHPGREAGTFTRTRANCPQCRAITHPPGLASTRARDARLEDYLFIGGPRLPAWQAAARLGVHIRTIERYNATIRHYSATRRGAS